jgi:acyl-CoA reductase-like NAD-dependent aldehyde dehydrogenase
MGPVILGGAKEGMRVWQEELFASLAACMTVNNDDEAVTVANRGGYGLSAAIFTEDLRKGLSLAKKLESG